MTFGPSAESFDLVRVTVLLVKSMLPIWLVPAGLTRRPNVLSCRFKTAGTILACLSVAVSVDFVLTSFGPEPIELMLVSDDFFTELLRDNGFRSGSFFQCVSTRAFTFFKSGTPEFSLAPIWMGTFLSFVGTTRALSVRFTKLPSAGRRAAVDVVSTVFLATPSAALLIAFYLF